MLELFNQFDRIGSSSVLRGRLPGEIKSEVGDIVDRCRQLRSHPLADLRQHANQGRNSYQVSVPEDLLTKSWLFPYLIALGEHYLEVKNPADRQVRLREITGHYDRYDIWVNFTEKGDSNPWHTHAGDLSGVIYWQNSHGEETVFRSGVRFSGTAGDIIIFPAGLEHMVDTKTTDAERITLSFNLEFLSQQLASSALDSIRKQVKPAESKYLI